MFKKIRNEPLAILVLVLMLGFGVIAAKPGGITGLTSLWIGDQTDTADVTPGANDLFVSGTAEIDGATRIDGAIDANSTLNVSGAVTFGTAGTISATEIADITRDIYFPMAGWAVDSGNDIDDSTAPDLTTVDNIPAIVWANSGETGGIQQTFRLGSNYVSGLVLYCLISSDTASGTSTALDWLIWDNANDVGFDGTEIAQSTVTATSTTLDASCEVLTLTLDATGEAAMTAGHWYTIEIFNATTHASANLELKGVHGTQTEPQ